MRHFLTTVGLSGVLVLLAGCIVSRPRSFFATDGVNFGTAIPAGADTYRLPMEFNPAGVASGEWIAGVKVRCEGDTIYVTAASSTPPRIFSNPQYDGNVMLSGLTRRTYFLKYRDPDGKITELGTVVLPR